MNGIEKAKNLYEKYGKKMIREQFPLYEDRIAVGLVGHGSECFGFDDELSKDHDFDGGFCLFLTDEDDVKIGLPLFRAYNELIEQYGEKTRKSALGGNTRGVQTINSLYARYTGGNPLNTQREWTCIPHYAIAEATNGEVFYDKLGEFSAMRQKLLTGEPEDTRLIRLATRILTMAQTGQYNFSRCIQRKEEAAAKHALFLFADVVGETVFILNRAYAPYYKWRYRAMKNLPKLSHIADDLATLFSSQNQQYLVEKICTDIREELVKQNLSTSKEEFLEPHAFQIFSKIQDRELKAMHILEG
ncbi:MAG: DUF4037 domain-containing protein [Clostridia bacterium]|nr:DUF4037 domain-containing protein [Clostridia bacterium]